MSSNDPFIYDEKSSCLYSPTGRLIKEVACPKAKHWNQLIAEDGEDRWRGCTECNERVINLDEMGVLQALGALNENPQTCIHASSNSQNVIFLRDRPSCIAENNPDHCPESEEVFIYTARSVEQINRAANMGYWPDVRWVDYKSESSTLMSSFMNVFQDQVSGRLVVLDGSNYRDPSRKRASDLHGCKEVIPERHYYPRYQPQPIAAYMIPVELPDGTEVVVADPIEDIVNGWERAFDVPGIVLNKKVVLELGKLKVRHIVG